MKNLMTKIILPTIFIFLWLAVCYPICNRPEGFNYFMFWIIAGLPFSYVIPVYIIDDAIERRLPHPDIIAIYVANNIIRWTLTQPDNIVTSMKHTRLDFPLKIQRQNYIMKSSNMYMT